MISLSCNVAVRLHKGRGMTKKAILGMVVSGLLLGLAARAHACGSGGNYAAGYALVLGGVAASGGIDITFSALDIYKASAGEHPGVGASVTEILLTAPQVAFGVWVASQLYTTSDKVWVLALSAWPAALTMHGIWGLATADREKSNDTPYYRVSDRRSWSVAPTVVSDGTNFVPGLGAVGRF